MSNFSKDLREYTDDELYKDINNLDPNYVSLLSDELTRRTLSKLQGTIKTFNEQSSKQTKKMIWLTWTIAILTGIMIFGIFYQIYLAIPKSTYCTTMLTLDPSTQHCETTYHLFLGKKLIIKYDSK